MKVFLKIGRNHEIGFFLEAIWARKLFNLVVLLSTLKVGPRKGIMELLVRQDLNFGKVFPTIRYLAIN